MQKTEHYGLVLNDGETKKLKELCIRYNIPITFSDLFNGDEPYHPMWAFSRDGIGLAGTAVMWSFSKHGVRIFHGVKDLEDFLEINIDKKAKR